ncbi:YjbE family putative metal transport protein [Saccharibacter floricola]|uniref:Integral membrane protein TerC n=1 Tax=Saccharibacter floricola DSM 15669 TaxID=1123227 RepID=A0ABQ0P012_9PROT|nr:YjbE family putative metal transport protein [Saccharibacter floricola]GBQ07785.1 integral membrane protein TerC [Saccharibacter floricola DSM 15669]
MALPMFLQEGLRLTGTILIDLALAGNNVIVIALAARNLPSKQQRALAIAFGIGFAAIMRISLTLIASHLLTTIGLTLLGGILLLWVCWKILRRLQNPNYLEGVRGSAYLGEAILNIVIADFAVSFDNIIAIAGVSIEHPWILSLGVALSVLIMIIASISAIRLLRRFPWLSWMGLAVLFCVSIRLIVHGCHALWPYIAH